MLDLLLVVGSATLVVLYMSLFIYEKNKQIKRLHEELDEMRRMELGRSFSERFGD